MTNIFKSLRKTRQTADLWNQHIDCFSGNNFWEQKLFPDKNSMKFIFQDVYCIPRGKPAKAKKEGMFSSAEKDQKFV